MSDNSNLIEVIENTVRQRVGSSEAMIAAEMVELISELVVRVDNLLEEDMYDERRGLHANRVRILDEAGNMAIGIAQQYQ